jgi:hypothetical protein
MKKFPLYWDKNFNETVILTNFDSKKGAGDSSQEPKNQSYALSVLNSPATLWKLLIIIDFFVLVNCKKRIRRCESPILLRYSDLDI